MREYIFLVQLSRHPSSTLILAPPPMWLSGKGNDDDDDDDNNIYVLVCSCLSPPTQCTTADASRGKGNDDDAFLIIFDRYGGISHQD
jgi:hypothetical protein